MPTYTRPDVRLISRPRLDMDEVVAYIDSVAGSGNHDWDSRAPLHHEHGQDLVEIAGRTCYRSWEPGLNPNVTRIRRDPTKYLANIIESQHGSVLEHANYTFIISGVSRVFTHEWVRHRAGTAISQESLRYVRLTDIPFWMPEWARNDPQLEGRAFALLAEMEKFQEWMADYFELDKPGLPFGEKKAKTSFMRRFAPEGVATALVWTANVRTLRHVIETRTAEGAEEEIRHVAGLVGRLMVLELPALFNDYVIDDTNAWIPGTRKV